MLLHSTQTLEQVYYTRNKGVRSGASSSWTTAANRAQQAWFRFDLLLCQLRFKGLNIVKYSKRSRDLALVADERQAGYYLWHFLEQTSFVWHRIHSNGERKVRHKLAKSFSGCFMWFHALNSLSPSN